MGKGINEDSMSRLLGGLTGHDNQETYPKSSSSAEPAKAAESKDSTNSKRSVSTKDAPKGSVERFCTIVETEQIEKIRMISSMEDVTIKDLVSLAFDVLIKKYENLHGKIKINKHKKDNLRDVFDL